ncbi:LEM domain-containing protein 1 [Oryx dammah]|uniref:LEM domain-containing protein 1 n=1 Tax=Oryx dammah TaxID=59534 RepID=UPI001A9AC03D|nr:LEM domain-containing protein 1 [Oryx dammah]
MVEVTCLSDDELQNKLNKLGFSPGPILPSTRKVYEKKLVQLLVSTPRAPPKKNRPGELSRARDNDGSEEFNATIILKRNITPSSEKSKGPKNVSTLALSGCRPLSLLSPAVTRTPTVSVGCAAKVSDIRCKALRSLKEKACCRVNRGAGDRSLEVFPTGLTLAVFGIFIIVIFVYITMENKSLFG